MTITIEKNKLCNEKQTIEINDSLITLIGENGCGKSTVLETIFQNYLNNPDYTIICFSSGQNERFTELFNSHKKQNKQFLKKEEDRIINSFYFNYDWVRVLVFFATILKPEGNVRKFLYSKNYIKIEDWQDVSSKLHFPFRIRKYYKNKIDNEIREEAKPDFDFEKKLLRKTHFHKTIVDLLSTFRIDYDFGNDKNKTLKKRDLVLNSENIYKIFTNKDVKRIFTFWALATHSYERNIDIEECTLRFNNSLEFKKLSDGEYQLLSIYALIDLFDSDKTIFLFDEIDSHLYYKNIEKIWKILKTKIEGNVITTTHITESILQNNYNNIRLIQKGKIEQNLTLRELAERLTSIAGKEKFEYELAARATNIVLIDDEVDWLIFRKLVEKKLEKKLNTVFDKIIPIKKTSSYNNTNESFGKGKLLFIKEFKRTNSKKETKNIFMICDRDNLSKNEIGSDLQVTINAEFKECKAFEGVNSYLFSWRRLEIENYLLSYSMLDSKGKLEELSNRFPHLKFEKNHNFDGMSDIEEFDSKSLTHPLYKQNGFNNELLDEVITLIPVSEISDDILNMYNFILSKIN
jgi:ABC-type multidrug transport system ATPase subunit